MIYVAGCHRFISTVSEVRSAVLDIFYYFTFIVFKYKLTNINIFDTEIINLVLTIVTSYV